MTTLDAGPPVAFVAHYGSLVLAIALYCLGGFYLWKSSKPDVFVGGSRTRAIVAGLLYVASAVCFTLGFAGRTVGSLSIDGAASFLVIAGAFTAPGGQNVSKDQSERQ